MDLNIKPLTVYSLTNITIKINFLKFKIEAYINNSLFCHIINRNTFLSEHNAQTIF